MLAQRDRRSCFRLFPTFPSLHHSGHCTCNRRSQEEHRVWDHPVQGSDARTGEAVVVVVLQPLPRSQLLPLRIKILP